MNDTVWISTAPGNSMRMEQTEYYDEYLINEDNFIKAQRKNDNGEKLNSTDFPVKIYLGSYDHGPAILSKESHIFLNGHCLISAKCAEVLRKFDLGNGGLFPVNVFNNDRKTKVDLDYFYINFGNIKKALLGDFSPGLRKSEYGPLYSSSYITADDSVLVSSLALEGADIWIDPTAMLAFFMSGRLVAALKKAGVAEQFDLFRCRVVSQFLI